MTAHRPPVRFWLALGLGAALWLVAGTASAAVHFRVPLGDHLGSSYVTAYRDHGSGSSLQDWHCGSKTYNGHDGTDIGIGGFAAMDAGRNVVAAARGKVVTVHDGEFDRCTSGSCGTANYVKVKHDDGKVSWYWHLKKFSIVVRVGQEVTCGQKLGQVGSSGHATGPHLHFEPHASSTSAAREPFHGACSSAASGWVEQGAYRSLPGTACDGPAPPPDHPQVSMKATIDTLPDQERDFAGEGTSEGIFDLKVGQTAEVHIDVTNAPAATAIVSAAEVELAVHPALRVTHWEIFDDYARNRCGGELCPNSANTHAGQPPHDDPGQSFALATDAISAGETKRITLTLEAVAEAAGSSHAPVQAFVSSIEGFYAKSAYDAAPSTNLMNLQTFNGGDLKVAAQLDVYPADPPPPDPGGMEIDPDGGTPATGGGTPATDGGTPATDGGTPAPDAGPGEASRADALPAEGPSPGATPEQVGPDDLSGGCSVGRPASGGPSPGVLLLVMALLPLLRTSRQRGRH